MNQLTQTAINTGKVTNYSHDGDGNMTSAFSSFYGVTNSRATYTYDEESRLTAITALPASQTTQVPAYKYEFVYDGLSRLRISRYYVRDVNNVLVLQNETRRVYDGMDVVQERDQNNNVNASYTRTGNIGGILARTTSAGSVFYGYDGGGNVVALTSNSGAQVGSYTYDAWGNTVATSGVAASENPYRFSTKEQIGGLYSYGFRFYSPGLGRWINRDPIAEAGGTNLYGFVGNDPVNMVDTNGLIGVAVQIGDFTLSTPGYGHFGGDLLFDKGSAQNASGDLSKGWYAGADGLNPFGDPYEKLGYYSPCDGVAQTSHALGTISQQALIFAATDGSSAAIERAAIASGAAVGRGAVIANAAADSGALSTGFELGKSGAFATKAVRAGGVNFVGNGVVGGFGGLGLGVIGGQVHNVREAGFAFGAGAITGSLGFRTAPITAKAIGYTAAGSVAGGIFVRQF